MRRHDRHISPTGLLDVEEREPRPTTVMRRDKLLLLVNATVALAVSAHAVPRILLDQRDRLAISHDETDDVDPGTMVPTIVFAIVCALSAMFVAIVMTA